MHFDDRLATVLRNRAAGERAARTQFRQLLDLLGERPQAGDRSLKAAAYLRLIALSEMIPPRDRAEIVGEAGWRFRNPELVKWFGEAAPGIAAAALYRARLTGEEWQAVIPLLPIRARGFLRHRRDLPAEAVAVLDRLGVQDRALPIPATSELELTADDLAPGDAGIAGAPSPDPPVDKPPSLSPSKSGTQSGDGIRALVERIEAFKRTRGNRGDVDASRSPQGSSVQGPTQKSIPTILFEADTLGRIVWAEQGLAPMIVGTDLASPLHEADVGREQFSRALLNHQPVRNLPFSLRGAPQISGSWVLDAAPRFSPNEGRFCGYAGRLRRAPTGTKVARTAEADRLRQLLHELRTPVNAIQGFAEVIQQQVFGPTPHEYRALAATIASDAARMLAGFEELDRLARLETGALDLQVGTSDFAAVLQEQVGQLQSVLSPRVARFEADWGRGSAVIALDQREAEMLAWRMLATLAATTGAGETIALALSLRDDHIEFRAALPALLRQSSDIFVADTRAPGGALSAGIFGAGFALRLARAEAKAAGGELLREADDLVLTLPAAAKMYEPTKHADMPDRAAH